MDAELLQFLGLLALAAGLSFGCFYIGLPQFLAEEEDKSLLALVVALLSGAAGAQASLDALRLSWARGVGKVAVWVMDHVPAVGGGYFHDLAVLSTFTLGAAVVVMLPVAIGMVPAVWLRMLRKGCTNQ